MSHPRRRRGRWLPLILALAAAPGAGLLAPAEATTVLALEVTDLIQRAALILTAEITEVKPMWAKVDGVAQIRTEITLNVEARLKGEWAEPTFRFSQPGGVIGEGAARQRMHVPGAAAFKAGSRVLVFLERTGAGGWAVVGMAQGLYTLETVEGVEVARRVVDDLHRLPQRRHEVRRFEGVPSAEDVLPLSALKARIRGLRPRMLEPRALEPRTLEVVEPGALKIVDPQIRRAP